MLLKPPASRGEHRAGFIAHEQLIPEYPPRCLDAPAYGSLRDMEVIGGAHEITRLDHFERFELTRYP